MKKLFKWVFRLLFWLVVLVVVLVLFRNVIAQTLLERRLRAETGMEVSIGRVQIGLTVPTLALLDLRMYNSDDFGRTSCLDVPELYVEYDPHALLAKRVHLKRVRLDLAELQVVRNDEGKSNFQALQERGLMKTSGDNGRKLEFERIDTLNLALGRFKYSNLKDPSEDDELYVGLRNQIVHNVKSLADLEPLMTRIALERNARRFYDKCFNRGTNAPDNDANPARNQSSRKIDTPELPSAKNP